MFEEPAQRRARRALIRDQLALFWMWKRKEEKEEWYPRAGSRIVSRGMLAMFHCGEGVDVVKVRRFCVLYGGEKVK